MNESGNKLDLFETGPSLTEDVRFAVLVFSLVPFLGILFSIPAIGMCLAALYKREGLYVNRLAVISLLVFALQIFLWSLLYLAPKLVNSTI